MPWCFLSSYHVIYSYLLLSIISPESYIKAKKKEKKKKKFGR